MATPKAHLLSCFLFCSIFLSFFHCTLSLLYPEDGVGFLVEADDVNMVQSSRDSSKICDFSVGKWVYDESYPLYDRNCPYLSTAVTCQKNGRPDSDYEKWKWKPNGCSIPSFEYKSGGWELGCYYVGDIG
ncbi:PMR5 N-terminal domain [Sesbania bispinosa]|nr:PMR5 N-terminal domain [Sesbania bispinosa]